MRVRKPKDVHRVHTHFHRRKDVYMLDNLVLVLGIWSMVFLSMLLVQGILSEVLTPGI